MPRPEKVEAVAEIRERIERARAVFLAEYAGLSVKAQQQLRRGLRAEGAEFKVVKMTLARRAASDLDLEGLDELLIGPTGVAFADEDPVGAAKVLRDFARANEVFVVKGGLLGRDMLSPERIGELAEIEPREVLLARLAGAMKAPMANLAGLLTALPRNAASVFQQLLEAREAAEAPEIPETGSEAAQDEAPETEAATSETTADEDLPAGGESAEESADTEDSATEDDDTAGTAEEE